MTTKEERYSREHKPSIKRESNHSASFDVILKNEISRCMKGFRATNVITYKRFRDKSTWLRPGEFANLVAEDEEEFRAEPKEVWPILQDMSIDLPVKELTKQHRVQDRYWTVPASNKKVRQPEPVYPQSTGVKLRPVEDIMNEYSKSNTPIAASGAANNTNSHKATPPQLPPSSNNNRAVSAKQTPVTHPVPTVASSSTPNASSAVGNSSTRTQDKNKRLMEPIPDKIKGVLQNLTDTTRRKPSSNTKTAKIYATKPNDKTTSVSSASKSKSVISPEKSTAVKKQQPLNVIQGTTASSARPRISSKSMPTEKTKYTENIPDLIEARKYLLGEMDEVECRSLKALQDSTRYRAYTETKFIFPFQSSI
ncbi:hypothetical protein BD560DRAFT_157668 [Blakeslea trispora]|nr:hypothetical protein BD560DRAFT_157668 [Blakeslea trispora]